MKHNLEISVDELKKLAKEENRNIEEFINEYNMALKDLEYTEREISNIIKKYKYIEFPNSLTLFDYGNKNELNTRYMCFDNLKDINNINKENVALVSGFGPTNAPTVGTLSMIFRILEFQKMTGIYTHIIISELGALNSRQKPLEELLINAQQFKMFIKKIRI